MAHYAKVVQGKVVKVIVADSDFFDSFVDTSPGRWIKTSYNTRAGVHVDNETPIRKNYAGVGYTYDKIKDAFYAPQPFASWTLDQTSCLWKPPVDYPSGNGIYKWNEQTTSWDSDST